MSTKAYKCQGAIFHVDSNWVLFEFKDPNGKDAVAVIKSYNIRLQNGTKIAKEACANLAEYLQIGDLLKGTVFRKVGLDKVLCPQEEEVQDENGQVRMSLSTIEIQPEWMAYTAGNE